MARAMDAMRPAFDLPACGAQGRARRETGTRGSGHASRPWRAVLSRGTHRGAPSSWWRGKKVPGNAWRGLGRAQIFPRVTHHPARVCPCAVKFSALEMKWRGLVRSPYWPENHLGAEIQIFG